MSEITSRIDQKLTEQSKIRADLLKATGLSESSIRNWIRGSIPSADAAYKVAKYLGVTVEWLVTGEEKNDCQKIDISEEERALIDIFRHLDERDKNAVITLAKSLESQYSSTNSQNIIVG